MEVENGPLEDDFPLQTVGFPLPCGVFVRSCIAFWCVSFFVYEPTGRSPTDPDRRLSEAVSLLGQTHLQSRRRRESARNGAPVIPCGWGAWGQTPFPGA